MKIVIQSSETNQFLTDGGIWVESIQEAMEFSNSEKALLHAASQGLNKVQIVLRFDGDDWHKRVPLDRDHQDGPPLGGKL